MTDITMYDDILDSRDIIEYLDDYDDEVEAYETEKDELEEELGNCEADDEECIKEVQRRLNELEFPFDAMEQEQYKAFADLRKYMDSRSGWDDGITFIADSYFTEYAQELAEDIGDLRQPAQWPYNCIDWDQAAQELQMDYTWVEIGTKGYWYWAY